MSAANKQYTIDDLRPSARAIALELEKRGATIEVIDVYDGIYLYRTPAGVTGYFRGSTPLGTSMIGAMVAEKKDVATKLAKQYGLDAPDEIATDDIDDALDLLKDYGRVVIKPINGTKGEGVVTDITSEDVLRGVWQSIDGRRLVQEQCAGEDLRIVLLDDKVLYAIARRPAHVVGDGVHTLAELVARDNNSNPERGSAHDTTPLKYISESHALDFVGSERYATEIPDKGKEVRVCGPSNNSIGGTVTSFTDQVLINSMLPRLVRMAHDLELRLVAFDFMMDTDTGRVMFIECNATPAIWVGEPEAIEKIVDSVLHKEI